MFRSAFILRRTQPSKRFWLFWQINTWPCCFGCMCLPSCCCSWPLSWWRTRKC